MTETHRRSPRESSSGQTGRRALKRPGRSDRDREGARAEEPSASGPSPSDAELVRRAEAGETDAFEPLVQRYSDILVRFARHMVGDFQTAEDIAQESFLKAFTHIGRIGEPEKFSTWLYSITRHLCLDRIRARRPAVSVEALADDGVEMSDDRAVPPRELVETGEMHGRVLREIERLRADYREILLMKHVYEFSYKQIGETVGLSVSAVGEKLSRVRQMLRERLASPRPTGRAGR